MILIQLNFGSGSDVSPTDSNPTKEAFRDQQSVYVSLILSCREANLIWLRLSSFPGAGGAEGEPSYWMEMLP